MTAPPHGVLILYNRPRADEPGAAFRESDAGVLDQVKAVAAALAALQIPYRETAVAQLADLNPVLLNAPEEIVFNLVESLDGKPDDACLVPALCRAGGKGFTGSDTPALLIRLDKWRCKAVLQAHGLPCPAGRLAPPGREPDLDGLFPGPYIVKPARADASEGIDNASVIPAAGPALLEAVRRVHAQLAQPAIVERFVDGRELNVSVVWHDHAPTVLPLAEIDFVGYGPDRPRIVGYEAKWLAESFEYRNTRRVIPAPLLPEIAGRVRDLAIEACRLLGCDDYARVDFRLDAQGRPFILEVNANPDLSPDAGFAAALAAAGIAFPAFVSGSLRLAARRLGRGRPPAAPEAEAEPADPRGIRVRRSRPEDRAAVLRMLEETGFFRPDEIEIGREVLDDALLKGPAGHYQSYVAEKDSQAVGWVCFGPTPCTLGTFEVYWIVVSPAHQRMGIGRRLMARVEREIARRNGRQILIDTSGRDAYNPTRAFYSGMGYREVSRLAGFYAPGDDLVVFGKLLTEPAAHGAETVSTRSAH